LAAVAVSAASVAVRLAGGTEYTALATPVMMQVFGPEIFRRLVESGVPFGTPPPTAASRLAPALLFLLPFAYLAASLKLMQRQLNPGNVAKKKRRDAVMKGGPSFRDCAGMDGAVAEVRQIVDFLRDPEQYQRIGARLPKGVLLFGPSGTGKTLLARAVAVEAGVSFFSCSASDFVEMLVGRGAARVRELFQKASECGGPAIVFIDELDALGKARGGLNSHDEREQTLNQLLTEMDGFEQSLRGAGTASNDDGSNEGSGRTWPVLVLAATNRPEVLDPALVRPGRFDSHICVGLPDEAGRAAILRVHARGVRLSSDVDLAHVAARTPGRSGAELAGLVNDAALLSVRRGLDVVDARAFDAAVGRCGVSIGHR
jgi:cell division protease FtsH